MPQNRPIFQISNCTASIESRKSAHLWLIHNPSHIPAVFQFAWNLHDPNQHKAAWIIELLLADQILLLQPELSQFCKTISKVSNETTKRSLGKIAYLACKNLKLNRKHKVILAETALDWLITDTKVASKCLAMQILGQLSNEFPEHIGLAWDSIQQQYPMSSPAFQSRAKKFKKQLESTKTK